MTIIGWLITTHSVMVKILLFALLLVAVVPNFYKNSMPKLVLWTRIGYFTFWAAWTSVVFSGLLVFAIERGKISTAIIFMIVAAIVIAFLDAYRAINLKKFWLKESLYERDLVEWHIWRKKKMFLLQQFIDIIYVDARARFHGLRPRRRRVLSYNAAAAVSSGSPSISRMLARAIFAVTVRVPRTKPASSALSHTRLIRRGTRQGIFREENRWGEE